MYHTNKQKQIIMKKQELNERINLRAMLINAETERNIKAYGENSATVKSKLFKENIGLFVSNVLKPVILSNK